MPVGDNKGMGAPDSGIPNPARMYDFFLGGKDNYAVDREAGERILAIAPETAALVRENRAFLRRAVEFLLDAGVRQFLDIGTGIPTQGSVHDIVTENTQVGGTLVVCVDNDPVACAHARALTSGTVPVLEADMREPSAIIEAARTHLDFKEPVGLVFASVLHFVPDDAQAQEIVTRFRDALSPGGHLVLSHGTTEGITADVAEEGTRVYRRSSAPSQLRSPEGIRGFFDGFTLAEPGLVNVARWRPTGEVFERTGAHLLGGVGRLD